MTIVGIDLGTGNSCVSVWNSALQRPEIITNEFGDSTFPSVVYIHSVTKDVFVGHAKYLPGPLEDYSVFSEIKRLIGRRLTPALAAQFPSLCLSEDSVSGLLLIETPLGLKTPEELSALVLARAKQLFTSYFSFFDSPLKAVITVPAYFNDAQRQATRRAADLAGIETVRIINEPTAASLAYGFRTPLSVQEQILVVIDIGSGTTDLTVLSLCDDYLFDVLATGGNTQLGGFDIDQAIAALFFPQWKSTLSSKHQRKLLAECERAKCALSNGQSLQVQLCIDCFGQDGTDWSASLSKSKLESCILESFASRVIRPLDQLLKDAGQTREQVSGIVLVGGSSWIPLVRKRIEEYFGKSVPKFTSTDLAFSPDHAIAYGAGIQAAILDGVQNSTLDKILLSDIIPLSIGIETEGGHMSVILPRNTKIPTRKEKVFAPIRKSLETSVDICVYEGERQLVKYNHYLGSFSFPLRTNEKRVHVQFSVDENGILEISIHEEYASHLKETKVIKPSIEMAKADSVASLEQNEAFYMYDQIVLERNTALSRLEHLCKETIQNGIYSRIFEVDETDEMDYIKQQLLETLEFVAISYLQPQTPELNDLRSEIKEYTTRYDRLYALINKMYFAPGALTKGQTMLSDLKK